MKIMMNVVIEVLIVIGQRVSAIRFIDTLN